jgi:hypothetical protein
MRVQKITSNRCPPQSAGNPHLRKAARTEHTWQDAHMASFAKAQLHFFAKVTRPNANLLHRIRHKDCMTPAHTTKSRFHNRVRKAVTRAAESAKYFLSAEGCLIRPSRFAITLAHDAGNRRQSSALKSKLMVGAARHCIIHCVRLAHTTNAAKQPHSKRNSCTESAIQ